MYRLYKGKQREEEMAKLVRIHEIEKIENSIFNDLTQLSNNPNKEEAKGPIAYLQDVLSGLNKAKFKVENS